MRTTVRRSQRKIHAARWSLLAAALFAIGLLVGVTPASTSLARLAANPVGYNVFLLASSATNPSQVVAVAHYGGDYGEGEEYVLMSDDGGQTWRVSATLPGDDLVDRLMGIALLGDGKTLLAIPMSGDIIRSEDGGNTWTIVEKKVYAGLEWPDDEGMQITTDPLHPSSAWMCSTEGLAVGGQFGLLSTHDGGVTWQLHKVRTNRKAFGGCWGLAVQPGGRVVLAYGDIAKPVKNGDVYSGNTRYPLFRSTDGGVHWKKIGCYIGTEKCVAQFEYPITHYGASFSFDERKSRTVFAYVGGDGGDPNAADVVFRSDDAGAHWRPAVLIAARTRTGPPRIYTKFRSSLKAGQGRNYYQGITDMSGRRLYPRAEFEGGEVFNIGGTLLVEGVRSLVMGKNGNSKLGSFEFLQSRNNGRGWSLFKVNGYSFPELVETATKNEILEYDDSGNTPSYLWHLRLSDHTWQKVPLGIPAPTASTTTTS